MGSLWQPAAVWDVVRLRAWLLREIRDFFAARDVLEVDTPSLSAAAASDIALQSFTVNYHGPGLAPGQELFLHTSPEFPMKRLLAAGSGAIYQLCKVFRDGEAGTRHNPEFTLLEWYRPGWDHWQLMEELETLLTSLLTARGLALEVRRYSYRALFQDYLAIDPLRAPVEALRQCALDAGIQPPEGMPANDPDPWRDLLLTHCIEPRLGPGLVLVYDYPASQAALAKIRQDDPPVAERFELYGNGIELANGFHELTDAGEQEARFAADNRRRQQQGLSPVPLDRHLLDALAHGLPACAGVALGVDRLLMLLAGVTDIRKVLTFPLERA